MTVIGSHTVTVIRPPQRDKRGDPVPGTGTETDLDGCSVQPRGGAAPTSSEATDLRDTVTTGLVVYVPPGADIKATDQVRWKGTVYQVDGDPAVWEDLDAVPDHSEVFLKRVEG